jgi:trk system potassium uptake protein TrkH
MGLSGCIFSLLMLIPAGVEYFMEDQLNFDVFVNSAMIGFFLSALVVCTFYSEEGVISHRASFVATTLVWIQIVFISAIPLYFANYPNSGISFADAVFEATSGITTSGITVLRNIDNISKGILLWRSMLHFFGGIGIIALVFIVMPYLQSGVMQLFTSESAETQAKEVPRIIDMIALIFAIYTICTISCASLYYMFGMTIFDAICHAMSTVSSGGFSSHDASFMYFNAPSLEIVAMIFMTISAIPFLVIIRFFIRRKFVYNSQVVLMLAIIACATVMLMLYFGSIDWNLTRRLLFAVISQITTTGFVSYDLSKSGDFFCVILILLGLIGGCSGSTSGGLKVFRLQVLYKMLKHHFLKVIYPHMVKPIKTNGQEISANTISSCVILLVLYMISIVVLLLILTAYKFDVKNSMALIAATLGNTGLIATEYGPFNVLTGQLTSTLKYILSVFMMLGRLEFVAVLIIIIQIFKKV